MFPTKQQVACCFESCELDNDANLMQPRDLSPSCTAQGRKILSLVLSTLAAVNSHGEHIAQAVDFVYEYIHISVSGTRRGNNRFVTRGDRLLESQERDEPRAKSPPWAQRSPVADFYPCGQSLDHNLPRARGQSTAAYRVKSGALLPKRLPRQADAAQRWP